jgi:DNA-directed RNA polymerase sigma subunit (sigma70/sigma32)
VTPTARSPRALLSGLPDREREILAARYGLDVDEQSRQKIGERLGRG